jgi:tetratricopeptide (TPR) repeat protein
VYDKAAQWFERYAKSYPKDEQADQALSDAVVLRLGLGQEEDAIRDADLFMKTYGRSKPQKTARVAFAIGAHYVEREEWNNAHKRLQDAMSIIDRNASLDVKAQAHALLGRSYSHLNRGTNADQEYRRTLGFWKNPDAAQKEILGSGDGGVRNLGKALEAVGEALFYFAEKEKKKVDKIKFPAFTGPNTREQVLKHINTKVKGWIQKKAPAITKAEKEYLKILELKPQPPPRWVIAAGSRVGGMWGTFVEEFRKAPIPDSMRRDDELRGIYYNNLDTASEPQKRHARGAYEKCLGYSLKYQYFDQYSRSCEVWLSKNYKSEYHQVDEFRGTANRFNGVLDERAYPLDVKGSPVNPNPAPQAEKKEKKEEPLPKPKPGRRR